MLTIRSTIHVAGNTVPQIIPVVQGDTARAILFTIADFTIPNGATANYYIQKPSGLAVYNAGTIDGNTVLVELTAQSIIEPGDNYLQVRILKDDDIVTSFDCILLVKPFRGIDATQSTGEMTIFDQAERAAAAQFQEDAESIAAEVIESIPSDYTALSNQVSDLSADFNLTLYYLAKETFSATSSGKWSSHGQTLLKAGKTYKIMSDASASTNKLRFFLWKTSTSATDTSYYVDVIQSNNETLIKPTSDSYLIFYNSDSVASISIDVYLFEYRSIQLTETVKTYYVAKTTDYYETCHYKSLTQCLLDLKDDETEKIIYVEGGTYDIYAEYVAAGVPVPADDVADSDYWNYNVWVPKNTHIIGRGIVKLIWSPTTSQTTVKQSNIVSPLNVSASCTIENVEVYCKNGRYCLHNDGLANVAFIGAIQRFVNCKFYKLANDTGYGKAMTTGFGMSARMQHIYEDCEFYNEITNAAAFYGHSRKLIGAWTITEVNSGNILLKNCIIVTPYTYSIRLDNDAVSGLRIKTKIENCYLSGAVRINEASGYDNAFDVIVMNSGNVSVTGNAGSYTPQIYQHA